MIVDSNPTTPETTPASFAGTTSTEFAVPSRHDPQDKQLPHAHLRYGCTCQEPPVVTLSEDTKEHPNSVNKRTFIENLRTHGWSPIVVPDAPCQSPSQEQILGIFRRRRNRQQQQQTRTTENNEDIVFIAAESGSSEGTIEPKESLEVQLSKCARNEDEKADDEFNPRGDSNNRDDMTVKTWCQTLSWIAHKICGLMLDLPENVFLPVDPNESLDLLRVFHYYAMSRETDAESSSSSDPLQSPTLGSSEHTDWGSLTVVWQDSVGGLQTYCRACNKWIDVKPAAAGIPPTTANEAMEGTRRCWKCIVHVGDMASLVLDRSNDNNNISIDPSATNTNNLVSYPWPSPRHRVKSHPEKERVSLVYFGYPPSGVSLHRIQKSLNEGWPHFSTRGQRLPLGEYFLLRNQSAKEETTAGAPSDDNDTEASRLYQTMWNLPIQDIVRLKWEQVNRG